MTVVLHIGMPHAGSSTIQHGLWRYRRELAAEGLFYFTGGAEQPLISSGNGAALAEYLIPERQGEGFSPEAFERDGWRRYVSPEHPISVISSESLAGARPRQLERFIDKLAGRQDVLIVAVMRDVYAHARSCWMQSVKRRLGVQDFEAFVQDEYKEIQCSVAVRYAKLFGVDRVRLLHFESLKGDLFGGFLEAIGVKARLEPPPQVNRGLTAAELKVLRLCNRIHGSAYLGGRISDHLITRHPERTRADVWSPGAAKLLTQRCRSRVAKVNAVLFGGEVMRVIGSEGRSAAPPPAEDELAIWGDVAEAVASAAVDGLMALPRRTARLLRGAGSG